MAPSPMQLLQALAADPLGERVVERAEIGRELVLEIAGQEAQALARLDRRPGQHDAADAAGLERLDRGGDGEIGLAGAGRPERQDQVVAADRRHEGALRFALAGGRCGHSLLALAPRRPGHAPTVPRTAARHSSGGGAASGVWPWSVLCWVRAEETAEAPRGGAGGARGKRCGKTCGGDARRPEDQGGGPRNRLPTRYRRNCRLSPAVVGRSGDTTMTWGLRVLIPGEKAAPAGPR